MQQLVSNLFNIFFVDRLTAGSYLETWLTAGNKLVAAWIQESSFGWEVVKQWEEF